VAEDDPNRVTKQYGFSPISLVANATHIPPVRLYATEDDSVPHQQAENMRTALLNRDPNADVVEYTMDGSEHCFNSWHMVNMESTVHECVSKQVIDFLNAHKNDP
jgi:dienelactone hydrolase